MNTDDLMSCGNCGLFFDVNIVKKEKSAFSSIYYICPLCKNKNH